MWCSKIMYHCRSYVLKIKYLLLYWLVVLAELLYLRKLIVLVCDLPWMGSLKTHTASFLPSKVLRISTMVLVHFRASVGKSWQSRSRLIVLDLPAPTSPRKCRDFVTVLTRHDMLESYKSRHLILTYIEWVRNGCVLARLNVNVFTKWQRMYSSF